MFIAIYGVILIGVFAASIYGYVQWFIGQTPWVLLLVPSGLFAITCLHVASLLGQRFSADQMILLRLRFDQLEHALLNGQTELRRES